MSKSLNNTLFFYQGDKLITVKQGDQQRAIFRNADMPLAEVQTGETPGTGLLVTDDKGSVLQVNGDEEEEPHAYSSYGHDPTLPSSSTSLAFNGEYLDATNRCYVLGNGYRTYSPSLMRFESPDGESPFHAGGLNSYAYCMGDPVNYTDPSGKMGLPNTGRLLKRAPPRFAPQELRQVFSLTHHRPRRTVSSPIVINPVELAADLSALTRPSSSTFTQPSIGNTGDSQQMARVDTREMPPNLLSRPSRERRYSTSSSDSTPPSSRECSEERQLVAQPLDSRQINVRRGYFDPNSPH